MKKMSNNNIISLNIDSYGLEARDSALADLVEIEALREHNLNESKLADYIHNCGWHIYSPEPFSGIGVSEYKNNDIGEDPIEVVWAESAFNLINERIEVLKDKYPFELSDDRLIYRGVKTWYSQYILLLSITTIHASQIKDTRFNPRNYFETIVAKALYNRGLEIAEVGYIRREVCGNFYDTLHECCRRINLTASPDEAIFKWKAHDEGVDVIAKLCWKDNRPGSWVFLGQVTCGRSNTWQSKSFLPNERWRKLLGMSNKPGVFLAVPHHIPELVAKYIYEGNINIMLLDRLRICSYLDDLVPKEKDIVDEFVGFVLNGE